MFSKLNLILLIIIYYISNTVSQSRVCDINSTDTVDLTKGNHLTNGVIYYEGIKYERNEYFVDESGVERGCICLKKQCINKCCPFGQGYDATKKICLNVTEKFDPPLWDKYKLLPNEKAADRFHFLIGKKACNLSIPEVRLAVGRAANDYHLRVDGQLYLELSHSIPPWMLRGPDKYCIDTFVEEDSYGKKSAHIDALICFAEDQIKISEYILSSSCMLISCVFILATLAVYAWLPELRNMHGMVLMVYLTCFFVAFMLLATMQILLIIQTISLTACVSLTITIYFALLSAFFWLNVMSFDIWWTFSGKRGHSARLKSTKARFLAYCGYAFGMSTALTVLLVALEFSGLPKRGYMPLLRHGACFITGSSKIIYLYGPMLILCIANLVFFVLTAMKIAQIRKQTSVLKAKDNSTHDQHRNDKQRLVLYVKLFMVMGINWVMEVLSALYPDIEYLWRFTDAYNVLIGVIIFIIFVCKRKIFRLIKKRYNGETSVVTKTRWERSMNRPQLEYKQLRGDPMTRNQTTISSRTASTRTDELQMNSVKK